MPRSMKISQTVWKLLERLAPFTRFTLSQNVKISDDWWFSQVLEGNARGLIDALYRHLPGGNKKNRNLNVV
jgi:hypothetical protein